MAVGDMDDCPHHGKQKVVLFCQSCDELICTKCISKSPTGSARHQDHIYLDLMDAYDVQREDMQKILVRLKESVDMKRQQRQQTLGRIQKLKFALLRKKGFVSKECRSLLGLVRTEEHHFKNRLENVISTALECEERAHKELDYDTVSREGLVGTVNSVSKISPFRCTLYLKNITRVKKEILAALERDKESPVLGSGNLWLTQINKLRDVTLYTHGERKALRRSFRFPSEAPSPPRVLHSWCVVGTDSASIVWKYKRQEKVDNFKVTCSPLNWEQTKHLLHERIFTVRPVVSKRNHVTLRQLEENCEYLLSIQAVNNVGESPPAKLHFHTNAQGESARQGRVWSETTRNLTRPSMNNFMKTVLGLVMTSLVLFALLWIIFATFEKELCGKLRERTSRTTFNDRFENMCPMPEQMRIEMLGGVEGAEIKVQEEDEENNSWLKWLNR